MELDDQLAALAAGDLAAEDATALRARVAADPALARRLARIERLDGHLASWPAPPLPAAARTTLDAAVTAALDALDDAPLAGAGVVGSTSTPRPLGDDPEDGGGQGAGVASGQDAHVIDMAEARRRRSLPSWLPNLAIAAALVGVVGVGLNASGLFGASDEDSTLATGDAADGTDATATDEMADADTMEQSDMADDSTASALAPPAEASGPVFRSGVTLADGELAALLDDVEVQWFAAARTSESERSEDVPATDGDDADEGTTDGAGTTAEPGSLAATACVDTALASTHRSEIALLGDGTYNGAEARFIVLLAASDDGTTMRFVAQVYDANCTLLEAVEREA